MSTQDLLAQFAPDEDVEEIPREEEEEEDLLAQFRPSEDKREETETKKPKTYGEKVKFLQKKLLSVPTQFALGALKRITYPLDLLQLAGLGEGLSDIDELEAIFEREGVPFDRDDYIKKTFQAASYFPTQDSAEAFLKHTLGVDLEPKTPGEKVARKTGEIFSLTGKDLIAKGIKDLTAHGAGSLVGATVAEGLKEAGVPEIIADIPGYGIGAGVGATRRIPKALTEEGKKAAATAEKFNFPILAGTEFEKVPKKPIVSVKKQKKLEAKLSTASEKAINEVIEKKQPFKKMVDKGYDLISAYEDGYAKARYQARVASKAKPEGISLQPLIDSIDNEIGAIKKSAPSLSDAQKVQLKILQREKKALSKKKLPGEKKAQAKNISLEQVITQKENWNSNLKDIYRKPKFTGAEKETKNTYGKLQKDLINLVEKEGHTDLVETLKFADSAYAAEKNLQQLDSIISPAFEGGYNPSKLKKILDNKNKRSFLKRQLGNEGVQDLREIASYGERAHDKVLSKLKNPKTVGEMISNLTPLKAALLFLPKTLKAAIKIPTWFYKVPIAVKNRVQGYLMTRPKTKKSYKGFLWGMASGKEGLMKSSSSALTKAINEEFGSEEALIKLAQEKES